MNETLLVMFEVWQGNTRKKSASFSCLDMGTRPLFVLFHFSNFGLQSLKNIQVNSYGFISGNKKETLNKCAKFHLNTSNQMVEAMI